LVNFWLVSQDVFILIINKSFLNPLSYLNFYGIIMQNLDVNISNLDIE
jgi:hypothetical protein